MAETDIFQNTSQIRAVEGPNMRLEWPVYAFTASVFLSFALSVQFLSLGTTAVVGLFVLLTVAYAWVAWVMVKQKAVLELHAYITCNKCGELTPSQGKHCMNCSAEL
jgi:dolichyl-phosphate-mannose--protein O-mannosyl transferase